MTGLLMLIVIATLIYIAIGLNISEELKIKNEYQKIFYSVESDKDYSEYVKELTKYKNPFQIIKMLLL